MSAWDKVLSFAQARSSDVEVIRDGLTYADARELLALMKAMAQVASDLAAKAIASASHDFMTPEINAVGELLSGLRPAPALVFPERFVDHMTALLKAGNSDVIVVESEPVCDHAGPFTSGPAATPPDRERMQLYNAGYEAGMRHGTNPRPSTPENDTEHAERLRNAPGLYEAIRWVDHYLVMPLTNGCPELLRDLRQRLVAEREYGPPRSELMDTTGKPPPKEQP